MKNINKKRVIIIPTPPKIINIYRFCILSETFPKKGGIITAVKANIEIINGIMLIFVPRSNRYKLKYVYNAIPTIFQIKTEIRIKTTDFFDIIKKITSI